MSTKVIERFAWSEPHHLNNRFNERTNSSNNRVIFLIIAWNFTKFETVACNYCANIVVE